MRLQVMDIPRVDDTGISNHMDVRFGQYWVQFLTDTPFEYDGPVSFLAFGKLPEDSEYRARVAGVVEEVLGRTLVEEVKNRIQDVRVDCGRDGVEKGVVQVRGDKVWVGSRSGCFDDGFEIDVGMCLKDVLPHPFNGDSEFICRKVTRDVLDRKCMLADVWGARCFAVPYVDSSELRDVAAKYLKEMTPSFSRNVIAYFVRKFGGDFSMRMYWKALHKGKRVACSVPVGRCKVLFYII